MNLLLSCHRCWREGLPNDARWNSFWKPLSNSWERPLGAFISEYMSAKGLSSDLLSDSDRKFRNDVIHKGHIPGRDRTIQLGQTVVDLIYPELLWLRSTHEVGLREALHRRMRLAYGSRIELVTSFNGRDLFSGSERDRFETGSMGSSLHKYLTFIGKKPSPNRA